MGMRVKKTTFCALGVTVALLLVLAPLAIAAHSVRESWPQMTAQIDHGQVAGALIVPAKSEVRVRLKNGEHFTAVYPSGGQSQATALLTSHGVAFQVHKTAAAKSSGHIRYRYIALAILAIGALAALGYYFLRGRPAPRPDGGTGAPAQPGESGAPAATTPARGPGDERAPPHG